MKLAKQKPDPASIKIHIGGPTGKLSIHPTDYETIFLCSGGIGVTPMLSIALDIARSNKSPPDHVVFVWSIRSTDMLAAFAPELQELMKLGDRLS